MFDVDMLSDGNMKGFGQGREGTEKNIIGWRTILEVCSWRGWKYFRQYGERQIKPEYQSDPFHSKIEMNI